METAARHKRLWMEVCTQAIAIGAMIWGLKICLAYIDPYREQREQAKKRAAFLKQQLGRALELNEFEQLLAAQVINPEHIEVEMQDVSGLESIVADLEMKLLYPLMHPHLYRTTLWKQTKGVLLYGPPGTGKTMLAKALAKQSKCFFLNITASSIMSKWLGDANRLVRAVFSLASKLEPCIIFIDEVDAMLGKRGNSSEHEAMLQVKTEFMQLWDGMESSRGQRVVVMGATNRPWMVDEAVLRRFTLMYEIGLPNKAQRKAILLGYLRKHNQEVPNSVAEELIALDRIADMAEGFSGSDLLELCSQAAQGVLAEHLQQQQSADPLPSSGRQSLSMRPLCMADLEGALQHVRPSLHRADEYNKVMASGGGSGGPLSTDMASMLAFLMQQMRG
ncbi:hypothetical protein VOLCADRAFT_73960 [Volvox carteri f. nagariensis]|uniref:AAA+ ATPase domain-containing protein n=1 Tax=Volvox carteri f. nagariensis TaxID=3068 RepID=D8TR19_VOLCA|nr:uncharacterized protein VOLCADRAFT_73960 [Volvox carteri f. nagariensis]EFJ50124.1 hypothetical protein VOLCADRAFT_73960 [Volvox carteri f. nagariensis]|eukprot:XP_002948744.1 hypothetical protein VOLCADRAFT_73960 [Volvox carteri f. nagariensis]